MTDRITLAEPIARIDPNLHGHFAEHLGRCIYGGLWVGADADVETVGGTDGDADDDPLSGVRADTATLLADLGLPVLRWPGGCFADEYHWEDGIGPREERPRRRNSHWTQGQADVPEESNHFGTDEFLALCEHLEAEPYLAGNVGTGSPDELADWVEYCNYDGDTDYAQLRRENGHPEPYGVTYWGVGNENWGCGGNYDPAQYAREYRRFATYLRSLRSPMGIDLDLIACGHFAGDWNEAFLAELGEDVDAVDHLSVHRYYSAGEATDFDDEEHYRLFAESRRLLDDVDDAAATIADHAPAGDVGVIVDEWGVWHPVAENDNGLEQPHTVRDAVSAAGILDGLHARADVVTMANLAQTVNVLQCLVQTDQTTAWATPTYRVFELYEPHRGATALETTVETERYEPDAPDGTPDVPLVTASASERDDELFVTVSNRGLDARDVEIAIGGAARDVASSTRCFDGIDPKAASTADNAESFAPEPCTVDVEDGVVAFEAPPCSVTAVGLE